VLGYCRKERNQGCCFGLEKVSGPLGAQNFGGEMKRLALALSLVAALWMSGLTQAAAQGRRGGQGKPPQTGVEHAETVANPKGVQHGIENAETKQGLHKGSKRTSKGKAKGKLKNQKHSTSR
jgi:hypothetical protein